MNELDAKAKRTAEFRTHEAARAFGAGDIQGAVRMLADVLGYVKWRSGNLCLDGIHKSTRNGFMVIGGGPAHAVEAPEAKAAPDNPHEGLPEGGWGGRHPDINTAPPLEPEPTLESAPLARRLCGFCGAALQYVSADSVACVNCGGVLENFQDDPPPE